MGERIYDGPLDSVEYMVLSDDRVEEALQVQQDSMRREVLAAGVGLYENKDSADVMKLVFREVIKDCCSLIAIDVKTDQIVAVCFNKLHVPPQNGYMDPLEEFVENNVADESCRALIGFLADAESSVDLFRHYEAGCLLEVFYVGTISEYGGRGIGLNMLKASIEFAARLGRAKLGNDAVPEVAFGVFTSNFSQRIASRLDFEWHATINYDEHVHSGKKLSERIGNVHKTARLGALRL